MKKILIPFFLMLLVALIGSQLYRLYAQRLELEKKDSKAETQVQTLKQENQKLTADIEYFSNFDNLIKEFKTLFNYRNPGEKLFIVVPRNTSH